MGPSRRLLGGHLGSSVSALLDGQLDEESTERAWQHVLHCPPCRRLVENEGWVKRQLAQISDVERADTPPDRLVGSLLGLDPAAAWAAAPEPERTSRGRRRAGLVLVGAGSVTAAVFGVTTLTGSPMGIGGSHGTPASNIGGSSSRPTSPTVSPAAVLRSRLPELRSGQGQTALGHTHATRRAR
jgi:predicted anti-sigma-YlaC factor YlaD